MRLIIVILSAVAAMVGEQTLTIQVAGVKQQDIPAINISLVGVDIRGSYDNGEIVFGPSPQIVPGKKLRINVKPPTFVIIFPYPNQIRVPDTPSEKDAITIARRGSVAALRSDQLMSAILDEYSKMPPRQPVNSSPSIADDFEGLIARVAADLGYSPSQLRTALEAWVNKPHTDAHLRALAALYKEQYGEAIDAAEKGIKDLTEQQAKADRAFDAQKLKLHLIEADAYARLLRFREAFEEFQAVHTLDSSNVHALVGMGEVCWGQNTLGRVDLEPETKAECPESSDYLGDALSAYKGEEETDLADKVEDLKDIAALSFHLSQQSDEDEDSPVPDTEQAKERQLLKASLDAIDREITNSSLASRPEVLTSIGVGYLGIHELGSAKAVFERAIAKLPRVPSPKSIEHQFLLTILDAITTYGLGRTDEAIMLANKALSHAGTLPTSQQLFLAHSTLGGMYFSRSDATATNVSEETMTMNGQTVYTSKRRLKTADDNEAIRHFRQAALVGAKLTKSQRPQALMQYLMLEKQVRKNGWLGDAEAALMDAAKAGIKLCPESIRLGRSMCDLILSRLGEDASDADHDDREAAAKLLYKSAVALMDAMPPTEDELEPYRQLLTSYADFLDDGKDKLQAKYIRDKASKLKAASAQ